MQNSRKQLLIAIAMILGGVLVFFVILDLLGIDLDEQPIGLLGWILGGVLIAPGFGYLIRWRRQMDSERVARTQGGR